MKRPFVLPAALVLTLALLFAATMPTALAAETAAAKATMPPATVTGTIEGTVLAIAENDIVVNMKNGNTINLMMNYISDTDAVIGDSVKIEYAGDIADRPEAVTITVTASTPAQTINGTVFIHDATSVFVQISSQQVYGFVIDKNTRITGNATNIVAGDTVALTYTGDLYNAPTAAKIDVTKAVKSRVETTPEPDKPEASKSLDGIVTKCTSKLVTIRTNKSNAYSFKLASGTLITGKYALETGARVTVYYNGTAAKSPTAKVVNVYAPPDPSPTSTPGPILKTTTGIVSSFGGMYLTLTSGFGCDCAYASYSGDSSRDVGDRAEVTYYVGSDKVNYATHIKFTSTAPTPTLAPTPAPEPVSKTVTGTVSSFGGMYLELTSGIGFDCAYASYSGNGNGSEGEEARVTYYRDSDGMNYATKINFTAIYVPEPVPEPEPEPEPDYDGGITFDETDPEVSSEGGSLVLD